MAKKPEKLTTTDWAKQRAVCLCSQCMDESEPPYKLRYVHNPKRKRKLMKKGIYVRWSKKHECWVWKMYR